MATSENDLFIAFSKDFCESFDKKYNDANTVWEQILNMVKLPQKEFEKRIVEYAEKFDSENVIIPILVKELVPKTKISVLGYAIILYSIYVKVYYNAGEASNIMCAIMQCPFVKIFIDVDAKNDCTLSDSVKFFIDLLKEKNYDIDFIVTKRNNEFTKNFHIVSVQQFDQLTSRELNLDLRNILREQCLNVKLIIDDDVELWAFPSGRMHSVDGKPVMSWDEFKSIAPIDIWNTNNFKTSTSILRFRGNSTTSREDHNHHQTNRFLEASTSENDIVQFIYMKMEKFDNFFQKYSNYIKFTYRNIQMANLSFDMKDLLIFNPITRRQRSPTDDDGLAKIFESIEGEEFYDIFHKTTLNYEKTLSDILDIDINSLIKFSTFDNIRDSMKMINFNRESISKETQYKNFILNQVIEGFSGGCGGDYDDFKRQEIIEKLADEFEDFDKCIRQLIRCIYDEDNNAPYIIIYMYILYTNRNDIPMQCTNSFKNYFLTHFQSKFSTDDINISGVADLEFELVSNVNSKDCDNWFTSITDMNNNNHSEKFSDTHKILIQIFKDIIVLMLNNGHVTSVLAQFIKYKIFMRDILLCTVIALNRLQLTAQSKFILRSYVSGVIEPYTSSVSKTIVQCFRSEFPYIYFLTGFYDLSLDEMWSKWSKLFPLSLDVKDLMTNEPTPKKFKKSKNNKQEDKLDNKNNVRIRFFNRCIISLYKNKSYYCFYENNRFHELCSDKSTTHIINCNNAIEFEVEPSHFSYWYRRECGIYCSITGIHEPHSPSLFSLISIQTPTELKAYGFDIHNHFNIQLKNILFDTFLKARHFIDLCILNKTMAIILGTIYSTFEVVPAAAAENDIKYIFNKVQIISCDLKDVILPFDKNFCQILKTKNELLNVFVHLYCIICTISHRCDIDLNNPIFMIDSIQTLAKDSINIDDISNNNRSNDVEKSADDSVMYTANESLFIRFIQNSFKKHCHSIHDINNQKKAAITINELKFNDTLFNREPNIFQIRETFDASFQCNSDLINEFDICQIDENIFTFIFSILSWIIRIRKNKGLSDIEFFKKIFKFQSVLYKQLCEIMFEIGGKFMTHSDVRHLAAYFKNFCLNTKIEVSNLKEIKIPYGYLLNPNLVIINQMTTTTTKDEDEIHNDLLNEIYLGIAGLILDSQFILDTFLDLVKTLCSFTHRGNTAREALALLNRSGTGKNAFIQLILKMFKTDSLQELQYDNLLNSEKDTGNILARPLNRNLVVWFDEVLTLNNTFKNIVNYGTLTERLFFKQERAEFRINSHIIISANDDPTAIDSAALARLMPIARKMQFVQLSKNRCFDRKDGVVDTITGTINDSLAVQLLLEKLPTGGEMHIHIVGLWLLIWLCNDIFLYKFSLPVSLRRSKTMQTQKHRYLYSAQPTKYILDNNIITFSASKCMEMEDFEQIAQEKLKKLGGICTSNSKIQNTIAELKDQLSKYIVDKKIYVQFN